MSKRQKELYHVFGNMNEGKTVIAIDPQADNTSESNLPQSPGVKIETVEEATAWVDSCKVEIIRSAKKQIEKLHGQFVKCVDDEDLVQEAYAAAISALSIHKAEPLSDFRRVFAMEMGRQIFTICPFENVVKEFDAGTNRGQAKENEIKAFASSLPCPNSPGAIEQIKKAVKDFRVTWQPAAGIKPSLAQTYQLVAKAIGFKTWEALVAVADRDTTSALTTTDLAPKTISIEGVLATSFEELKSMDSRLIGLECLLQDVVSKHGDKPYWCANYYWYGLIKPRLTKLVGWARNSKPVDRSQMPRTEAGEMIAIKVSDFINSPPRENDDPLATSKAYEIAYSALEAMLPPCRHNQHGCPPYGDLANNARAFSDITILSFLVDCVFSPKTNAVEEQYHKTIIQLLHELVKHGECPSVVWPHKIYPGAKPAGNSAFQMLANINLLDHSLRVARLSAGKGLPKNVTKGEAIIAALAHDLGKIPIHRRNHQPQDVDHPWVSASVLGSLQDLYSIPSAKQGGSEYILDAVAGHHSLEVNNLGAWIGSCDARARTAELRALKAQKQ